MQAMSQFETYHYSKAIQISVDDSCGMLCRVASLKYTFRSENLKSHKGGKVHIPYMCHLFLCSQDQF